MVYYYRLNLLLFFSEQYTIINKNEIPLIFIQQDDIGEENLI